MNSTSEEMTKSCALGSELEKCTMTDPTNSLHADLLASDGASMR